MTERSPVKGLPDIDALRGRVCGHRLPGGRYEIDGATAVAVARLAGLDAPLPHPVFASIASLRSLGVSIAELCELCDFRLEDGPMLGELRIRYLSPLRQGVKYDVTATIESIDRTTSSRAGVLDRLRFTVQIAEPGCEPTAELRYLWLLPRHGGRA